MPAAEAAAAALAVVLELTERDLPMRVKHMGGKLLSALEAQFSQHSHIGDIRGRGLFCGIEIVEDRSTKTPFDSALGFTAKIKKLALENGLICYPMSGTRDGKHGDHILLAPPFIIEDAQISELVKKLTKTIKTVLPE